MIPPTLAAVMHLRYRTQRIRYNRGRLPLIGYTGD